MNTQIRAPEKRVRARGCCKVARRSGRDSGLDRPRRNPGAAAEVSGVFGRLSDDGNRNQYFCCGGREPGERSSLSCALARSFFLGEDTFAT